MVFSCDASTSPPWRVYRVGDETLSHVALKTNVSVARLRSINHLPDDAHVGLQGDVAERLVADAVHAPRR
jgi:hypothetical protein